MLIKSRLFLIILSLALTCSGPIALADNLPDLGDPSKTKFTTYEEQQMAKDFLIMIRASGRIIDDPVDNQYLSDLGKRLVQNSPSPNKHFAFYWFASRAINAFAGPDGNIFMHTQLFLATSNEDEFAGVMAHEIGHVVQGHLARGIAEQKTLKMGALAGLLAALAIGMVAPNAAAGAVTAAMAGAEQQMLNYSRAHEKEADRVGIKILAKTGFNPWGMPSFFKRMLQDERLYQKIPALLNDHPLTQERISDTENRASQYPKKYNKSPLQYYLIKERIRVQTFGNQHKLLNRYQHIINNKTYNNKTAIQYGYGLSLMLNHKSEKAIKIFEALDQQYPKKIIFKLAIADAADELHQFKRSISILKKLHQSYPDNYAIMAYYADTLLKSQRPQQALNLMQDYALSNPNHPVLYGTLARAQAKTERVAQAYQTRANYLLTIGQDADAMDQLKMALTMPKIDRDTKERVQAQLKQLREEAKNREG